MRKIALTIGSLAMLGGIIGTAGAAHADTCAGSCQSDVSADATISETLSVVGITNAVHFNQVAPGQTVTVNGAEAYTIQTNHASGATISISGMGFYDGGSTKIMGASALTIHNASGNKTLADAGPTMLASVPAGSTAQSEDWSLSVPGSVTYAGTTSGTFRYSVVSN